ncbi:hypothetical protein CVT24_011675 [Panaeolus cyanescens]|uniref:Uncharacterized protein n=1 Tax=Panaeolus cyanescens TaxID=181874 RepID=A0A409YH86_9AGAR|nr:hypothetical protein CVT24_011675 [Panaeolus cyanescens]
MSDPKHESPENASAKAEATLVTWACDRAILILFGLPVAASLTFLCAVITFFTLRVLLEPLNVILMAINVPTIAQDSFLSDALSYTLYR